MKGRVLAVVVVISIMLLITSCSEKTTEPTPTLPAPTFTPPGGTYDTEQVITISCETEDAIIRYTKDGSVPTTSSTLYQDPIIVSEPTTLKARAYKSGWEESEVSSATYDLQITNVGHIHLTPEYRENGVWKLFPEAGIEVSYDFRITAYVTDEDDEPYGEEVEISFSTTLGEIDEVAVTDNQSKAYVRFYPLENVGLAQITATALGGTVTSSVQMNILSESVHNIYLINQQEMYLDVTGVGGTEERSVIVHLTGSDGNLVIGSHWVRYEITAGPQGVIINNFGQYDEVRSTDGIATASISTGTKPGRVTLRVSIRDNPEIYTVKSDIIVNPGPPSNIELYMDAEPDYEAQGGGNYRSPVYAEVTDRYFNPVKDATSVNFTLGQSPPPSETMSIDPAADTHNGKATTYLNYHFIDTLKMVTVYAHIGDAVDSELFGFPSLGLTLEVVAEPAEIDFYHGSNSYTDPVFIDVTIKCYLTDGLDEPIPGAKLLIISTHGSLRYHQLAVPFPPVPPQPEYIYTMDGTGHFGDNGWAYGIIRCFGWEVPPPIEEGFKMIDIQILVTIPGMDVVGQTTITARRHFSPLPSP